MQAYLQHKASEQGPFCTESVTVTDSPLWWHEQGLQYTATGYGKRIPSRFKVYFEGKWRRVYVTQYSNVGSAWINFQSEEIRADIWQD